LYDLEIDSWVLHENIDYDSYKIEKPVYYTQDVMNRQLIGNKGGAKILKLYIMQNEIEFSDSIFDFGQTSYEGDFYNVARKDIQENIIE
jgi:hypothetical protein